MGRLRWVVPALLTTTSIRPNASCARPISAATSASTATLPARNTALPEAAVISRVTRSPASALRSLRTRRAPSCANRRAIPSPNPEPAPVTIATLPASLTWTRPDASRCPGSPVAQHDRLERRAAVQRFEALLAAVAGMLDAAERKLDAAAGAETVDEHLPAADRARHAQLSAAVCGPHSGHQPEVGGVGEPRSIGLVGEGHRGEHGAE